MRSTPKILIVDDNATNRLFLRMQLESIGYLVFDAIDGVDALAHLEREPIDAVIADILMPRMDGFRLCHEIRKDERLRHLPLVVYTGTYVSAEDERLARRSGADRYLLKPAPTAVWQRILGEILSGPSRPDPAPPASSDVTVMQEYNAVLIHKLEDKTHELEAKNFELVRVNAELEESRARAAGIIASAMDAIVTVDDQSCIRLFNAAAEAMFRFESAQIIDKTLDRIIPSAQNPDLGRSLLRRDGAGTTSQESSERCGLIGRRADGEEFPIEASVSRNEVSGRKLLTLIFRDVTERQRTEREIRLVSEQMRALALRAESVREQERTRLAREIHDVLAQELTRLKIDLVWLAKRATKAIEEPTRVAMSGRITDALAQTDIAISTVQRIATELRPVILDSLGLPAAADWLAEDFSRRTGIACHVTTSGGAFLLDRERATALFRILQESLTNIARHAQASLIDIQLSEGEGYVALTVRDNGLGITLEKLADPFSIGLTGMRERAQAFGGTVEIAHAGAGGTVVAARLPLGQTIDAPPPP